MQTEKLFYKDSFVKEFQAKVIFCDLCNDYWNKRIMFREYDRLIITKGYPKRDDSSRRIDVPYGGYEIKTITHPHFGDKPVKVFAIKVNIDNE